MQVQHLLACLLAGPVPALAQSPVHHDLAVRLDPASHVLEVQDVVQFPEDLGLGTVELVLSDALDLRSSVPPLEVVGTEDGRTRYALSLGSTGPARSVTLEYGGAIDFGLSDASDEYTRGFRESRGALGPEGVYLHGGSDWVPGVDERMVTFTLDVDGPRDWHLISQGSGDSRVTEGHAHWASTLAMDEVYIVGGPLIRFRDQAGEVETLVYLHEPDAALANKYLEATAQYLQMYSDLIGPYPYGKFAMVENFWETGFGMPSFTLLGPEIVRFPFILHSSYPHEILHNWWGNSVFVDYARGNWCEGLTAYMADHLVQEQRGKGAAYRRGALQKYRDYVKAGRDFPLREFTSRHNAATEAIGYGKSSMMFHMLRRKLGDEAFIAGLQKFYAEFRGRRASFDDIEATMAASSGMELEGFFDQWLDRVGAPKLRLSDVTVGQPGGTYTLAGTLTQEQEDAPYSVDVPVTVQTSEGDRELTVHLRGEDTTFQMELPGRPLRVTVDPLFDVFRVLDPRETPPSIGQMFGSEAVVAILPGDDPARENYRELVGTWQSDQHDVVFALDSEFETLPAHKAVWILGRANRFAPALAEALPGLQVTADSLVLGGEPVKFVNHTSVVMARHPSNPELAVGWIVLDPAAARPGLARKLPHYGKYSYLAFEGPEPTNVVKGQWSADASPLVHNLQEAPLAPVVDRRDALAETPPVFSSARMGAHVEWLASPERAGRGLGSPELDASADYIAAAFGEAGLEPGGDNHTWFQEFTVPEGPDGEPVTARNVVGILRGSDPDMAQQSVVLGAHYDHLGRGWPDAHAGDLGVVHPGADDNASGVAVMIELARQIRSAGGGARNLVVVAFTAEECGLKGSEHYVSAPRFPMDQVIGMINLDTVGRLDGGAISIHGTGTADEWQHIFRGAGFVTGIANKIVPDLTEGSDQWSFVQAGVPAVQIFTGATADYHRPSDTADKVDLEGLVQVASFVREAVVYLLEREGALTSSLTALAGTHPGDASPPEQRKPTAGRRVSFGSVPDFGFQGEGMRFDGVTPGSPADRAGLLAGDVLVRVNETEITSLRDFSNCLKGLSPGQTVGVTVMRDGKELSADVTLTKR